MLGRRHMVEQFGSPSVAVELVSGEYPGGVALGKRTLLQRLDQLEYGACCFGLVEAMPETRLVAGVAQRHDADVQDAGPFIGPFERLLQHFTVVRIGNEHDLRVELDSCCEQAIEHFDAVCCVLADHPSAHVLVNHLQRYAQR